MQLQKHLRSVPDWPRPGVTFLDIAPILQTPDFFARSIGLMDRQARTWQTEISSIVAVESRGFVFGSALATRMQLPLTLCRKAGKLPGATYDIAYDTEYSRDCLSIQQQSVIGTNPLIVDDILATGGTIVAVSDLLRQHFEVRQVFACVLFELDFLPGRSTLEKSSILLQSVERIS